MKYWLLSILPALLLGGCQQQISEQAHAATPAAATAANPIVIELFQSQGCSSCPPANAALNAVAGRSNLIALSFGVTYWDQLGWKDSFASKANTERQYAYAAALGKKGVYTPQVVINGSRAIVGNGPGELNKAIAATKPVGGAPDIARTGETVRIGSGKGRATVWLVRYDPQTRNVPIRAGENNGRTLPHRNIVRQLQRLGEWRGTNVSYTLGKPADAGLQSVILVQRNGTGPIIAAKKI